MYVRQVGLLYFNSFIFQSPISINFALTDVIQALHFSLRCATPKQLRRVYTKKGTKFCSLNKQI